jgi:lipoyl(octanoyl) transferase
MREKGIFLDLGTCDYQEAWELQHLLWAKRVKGTLPDTVLFLEHPHTITLGRRGNRSHLKASPETLEKLKIPVIQVERGGDITYHGPGQAVIYPILHLEEHGLNISQYVERLEEFIIEVLSDFAIEGKRSPQKRGVWVGDDKVASIGVTISKWVSFHGLALNYHTNLQYFDLINACGLENNKMTSFAKILGRKISKGHLYKSLGVHFRNLFKRDWQEKQLGEIENLLND